MPDGYSLGAELHDRLRDTFRLHEATLHVEWKSEWLGSKFVSEFIGPPLLDTTGYGKHNTVEVHPVENEQSWESFKDVAAMSVPRCLE